MYVCMYVHILCVCKYILYVHAYIVQKYTCIYTYIHTVHIQYLLFKNHIYVIHIQYTYILYIQYTYIHTLVPTR